MSETRIFTHLKDYSYYNELYDKSTIKECKRLEKRAGSGSLAKRKYKNPAKAKYAKFVEEYAAQLIIFFVKGERYANKSETIQEWMDRDKSKDEKLASAAEPRGVRCFNCSVLLTRCTFRDLMNNDHQGKEEVLFMFECDKCGKRRSYWEDGREWEYKPTCLKCNSPVQTKRFRKGKVIKTIYSCSRCGYKEVDIMDLNKKEEPIDPDFEKNRKKYCLSEEEGGRYLSEKTNLESIKDFMDKWKEKQKNKKLYNAIAKIKKITIAELQILLNPLIEKAGYSKLEFEKPNIQRDVILSFSLQDNKPGREEYDSVHDLTKIIKKSLEGTNWRLMTDGINYRLGFLTGRLRGVEGEENIRKLVETKNRRK